MEPLHYILLKYIQLPIHIVSIMHVLLKQNLINNLFKSSAVEMMAKYTMLKSSSKVTTTQCCLVLKVKYNTMEIFICSAI